MAIYFFHLHECGDVTLDEEGREIADIEAARRSAVLAAREVMAAEVKIGKLCLACYIEIRDDRGDHVLTVPFREVLTVTGN